jgi:hypothetical protein
MNTYIAFWIQFSSVSSSYCCFDKVDLHFVLASEKLPQVSVFTRIWNKNNSQVKTQKLIDTDDVSMNITHKMSYDSKIEKSFNLLTFFAECTEHLLLPYVSIPIISLSST